MSPEAVDSISFLTFNAGLLQLRLLGVRLFRNPPFTWRRLLHLPTALRAANADIAALQEVYEAQQSDYIVESLRLVYPYSARRMSGGGLITLHNGLLILSKFPIIYTAFHPFQHITWSERMIGSKGILEAVMQVPGVGLVCILNVHMVSGTVDPESRALDALRAEETREVLKLAKSAENRGECPVILGDFNASVRVCPASYQSMMAAEWVDGYTVGQEGSCYSEDFGSDEDEFMFGKDEEKRRRASSSWTGDEDKVWTWDPRNPLNLVGPHAQCHGLRCDHVFLPPKAMQRGLKRFKIHNSRILFDRPRVLVQETFVNTCLGPIIGGINAPILITLSDHYAVRVELRRLPQSPLSSDDDDDDDDDDQDEAIDVQLSTEAVQLSTEAT